MTHDEFKSWLDAYGRAWKNRNAHAAAELYAEDGTYQETPFVQPMRGREEILAYWTHIARSYGDIEFGYEILAIVEHDGIAHWQASFTRVADKSLVNLDGVFVITLGSDRRCTSLREWWQKKESRPNNVVELSPSVRRASPVAPEPGNE